MFETAGVRILKAEFGIRNPKVPFVQIVQIVQIVHFDTFRAVCASKRMRRLAMMRTGASRPFGL